MLSLEEERKYAVAFYDHDDRDAGKNLLMSHLRLSISTAKNFRNYGLPEEDLIQEGNIGLLKALDRFDPHKGVRFATFAIYWIKSAIMEFILRNIRIVKIATTKAQRKLFFKLRSKLNEYADRNLTREHTSQIAKDLDVKPEDVEIMRYRLSTIDVPFEREDSNDDHEGFPPSSYLADPAMGVEERLVESDERGSRTRLMNEALAALDDRSREVLMARVPDENGKRATLQELGDKFGVSAERVRQIEERGRGLVRDHFSQACA
jgi:RNA polymerase sigma-32 factor